MLYMMIYVIRVFIVLRRYRLVVYGLFLLLMVDTFYLLQKVRFTGFPGRKSAGRSGNGFRTVKSRTHNKRK